MLDDKFRAGGQDRSCVAAGQDYKVRQFAERHGLSAEQAEQPIAEHGNNRDKPDEATRQMKG